MINAEKRPVAFITGGSRGIGYGIAEHLAKAGFDLAINGVRPEEAVRDALDALRNRGSDVLYCQGDIASSETRQAMMQSIQSHFGQLNVLVNNAGVAPKERRDILEATEESFQYVLSTNLQGAYFLTQAAANWMIAQRAEQADFWACIINVSSISATVASVNRGEYCVAKAGLSMATQLFAVRLGEFDIPVYEVRPGVIKTDMTAGVTAKYDALIESGLCVQKRWGFADDVGRAVASLARGDFPYSTGQVIMVDGGLTLPRL
ncbi:3-ketoacyl-ACP reductase [Spirosoma endbachense]|uniref:3-ketoacyl-ACP reductase n=1 Tax=Spirosoma endbachense TaxID=2666025 RepID=A0A6P1VQG8_9BACT|nr:3-ketoacyl-ACP reductase [Spirosoma endbachense]QHV94854.1 3-ketoacyl-ACP reductase [Spirosoma endbachense]